MSFKYINRDAIYIESSSKTIKLSDLKKFKQQDERYKNDIYIPAIELIAGLENVSVDRVILETSEFPMIFGETSELLDNDNNREKLLSYRVLIEERGENIKQYIIDSDIQHLYTMICNDISDFLLYGLDKRLDKKENISEYISEIDKVDLSPFSKGYSENVFIAYKVFIKQVFEEFLKMEDEELEEIMCEGLLRYLSL